MSATAQTRKGSRVPGARLLITASALAATLAGWASLVWKASADAAVVAPGLTSAEAQLAAAGISLQPLPTLVPGSGQLPRSAVISASQSQTQPALRSVGGLPAPVTLTQSSRP